MLRKSIVLGAVTILLTLAASVVLADEHVHALTSETFDSTLGSKPALVEFYAPWCGHCKNLEPIYAQLGEAFSTKKDKLLIAKADADSERTLASRFGIRGYPTIKWFPQGIDAVAEEYNGGRDLESLTEFVTKKTGLKGMVKKVVSAVEVVTDRDFEEKVLKSGKNVLVEFYAPWCGHCKNLAPTYEKLAADFANEKNMKKTLIEMGKKAANESQDKNAKHYLRVFEKAGESDEFIVNEKKRLEKIMEEGKVTPMKMDEFAVRHNIISAFVAAADAPAQAATAEKVDELERDEL
ncbi:hypothetical protein BGZ90_010684 [Linnemannia elongata]|nr:hypothetical protein BGZ90_010684 [Linnemannia elongata]